MEHDLPDTDFSPCLKLYCLDDKYVMHVALNPRHKELASVHQLGKGSAHQTFST